MFTSFEWDVHILHQNYCGDEIKRLWKQKESSENDAYSDLPGIIGESSSGTAGRVGGSHSWSYPRDRYPQLSPRL